MDHIAQGLTGLIRRERRLPFSGQVLVKEGDRVSPDQVIAVAEWGSDVLILDIARALNLSPDEAGEYLVRKVGDRLQPDDVIAQKDGAIPRLVRSPVNGTLVDCRQGRVVLQTAVASIEVCANMIGIVETVLPEEGAVITAHGVLIQGVWGNGKIGMGPIQVVDQVTDMFVEALAENGAEHGPVVVAGWCEKASDIKHLADLGVGGVIVGSMTPDLIAAAVDVPVPVIVLNGFGPFSTDPDLINQLKERQGEIASVNASPADVFTGHLPEVIIPTVKPDQELQSESPAELEIGQKVRLLSGKAAGQMGTVVECPETPILFESGVENFAAIVNLGNGEDVTIPVDNLLIVQN